MIGNSGFRLHIKDNADDLPIKQDEPPQFNIQPSRSRDLGRTNQYMMDLGNNMKPSGYPLMDSVQEISELNSGFAAKLNFDLDFDSGPVQLRTAAVQYTGSDDKMNIWSGAMDKNDQWFWCLI